MTTISFAPAPIAPSSTIASSAWSTRTVVNITRDAQPQQPAAGEPAGYYGPADGKTGAALLRSLHEIVRNGHTDRGYAQARDGLFANVADADRDDMIPDLYTGELRGPITNRGDAFTLGFNTEHTWPQSMGATGIAKSDLHQLMPADVVTNQNRGHMPYGEVEQVEWSVGEGVNQSKLGENALGRTVFEPRDPVKGDIARALLYFYTRYDHSRPGKYSLENFKQEVANLVRWHDADPVDAAERSRNDDVFAIQGNRNPYIDHPELVAKVGFDQLDLKR